MNPIQQSIDYIQYLIEEIMCVTQHALKGAASAVLVLDGENQELRFRFVQGPMQAMLKDATLGMETGFEGWVARQGKPLVVNDVSKDERFCKDIDEITGFTTRSIICAPLFSNNVVIGVIEVINKLDGSNFSQKDLQTLVSVASTFARAIQLRLTGEAVLDSKARYKELVDNLTVRELKLFDPYSSPREEVDIESADIRHSGSRRVGRDDNEAKQETPPEMIPPAANRTLRDAEKRAGKIMAEVEARARRRRQAILGCIAEHNSNCSAEMPDRQAGIKAQKARSETAQHLSEMDDERPHSEEIGALHNGELQDVLSPNEMAAGLCSHANSNEIEKLKPDECSEVLSEQTGTASEGNSLALFEGIVEIELIPPVSLGPVLRIHRLLTDTPSVDVINVGGSLDKGIIIRASVGNPVPLIDVIGQVSEVDKVVEESDNAEHTAPVRSKEGERNSRRIVVGVRS